MLRQHFLSLFFFFYFLLYSITVVPFSSFALFYPAYPPLPQSTVNNNFRKYHISNFIKMFNIKISPPNISCLDTNIFFSFFLKILFILFFREGEKERNTNVCLPLVHPLLGTWPATQACALIGNQSGDPLIRRPVLNH